MKAIVLIVIYFFTVNGVSTLYMTVNSISIRSTCRNVTSEEMVDYAHVPSFSSAVMLQLLILAYLRGSGSGT